MVTNLIFTILSSGAKGLVDVFGQLNTSAKATFSLLGNQGVKDSAKLLLGFKQVGLQLREFSDNELNNIINEFNRLKMSTTNVDDAINSLSFDQKWIKDYLNGLNGAEASLEGITKAANNAKIAQQGMAVSSQAAAVGIKVLQGVATMGAILILTTAIQAAVTAFDEWNRRIEIQKEKIKELESEYNSLTSEIKSVEDELDLIANKIDELNSKPALSFLEKDELSNLQETNRELEARIALLEREEQIAAKRLANESQLLYDRTYGRYENSENQIQQYELTGNASLIDNETNISALIAGYRQIVELKKEADSPELLLQYSNILSEVESQLLTASSELQNIKNNLTSLKDPTEEQRQTLDEIAVAMDLINTLLIPEKWNAIKFDEIFNLDKFAAAKASILEIADAGELTVSVFEQRFPSLVKALNDAGISVEDAISHINASFDEIETSLETIIPDIDSLIDSLVNLESGYNTLISAQNELNETGHMTAAAFNTLTDNNLLQYLAQTEDGVWYVTDALEAQFEALKADAIATATNAANKEILAIAETYVGNEAANAKPKIDNIGDATKIAGEKASEGSIGLIEFATAAASISGSENLVEFQTEYDRVANQLKNTIAGINSLHIEYSNNTKSAASATKSATDAQREYISALQSAQSAIQSLMSMTVSMLKQQYNDEKSLIQGRLSALTDSYNKQKKLETDSYNSRKKNLESEKKNLQDTSKAEKKRFDDRKKEENNLFNLAKKRHDANKKAIDDETKAYEKRIQTQLDLLKATEDERDYQADLLSRQKAVANIENEISKIQFDTSEQAAKKRRELEENLAKEQASLAEFQHDRSIDLTENALRTELDNFKDSQNAKLDELNKQWDEEQLQHENRLNSIQAEQDAWQDSYDNQMAALQSQSDWLSEEHQDNLTRIDQNYQSQKSSLEKQIKDIEEKLSNEVALHNEATDLMDSKSEEFYNSLMKYMTEYTTLTDAEMKAVWENAYKVLDAYNGKQINTKNTLNELVLEMNSFDESIGKAVIAMEKLAIAAAQVKVPDVSNVNVDSSNSNTNRRLRKAHTGGIIGETPLQQHNGVFKPNESLIVVEDDETILSNKKSASDINNALSYIDDALGGNSLSTFASFLNISPSSSTIPNIASTPIATMLQNNIGTNSKLANTERLPIGSNTTNQYHIDNSKSIVGYEVDKMRQIASQQDESLMRKLGNYQKNNGQGLNYARR